MNILQICPLHPSDVANLPWEIQKKVIWNTVYNTKPTCKIKSKVVIKIELFRLAYDRPVTDN